MRRLRHSPPILCVVGIFVIENHCGNLPVDHKQLALHFLEQGYYERALVEAERAGREEANSSGPRMIAALAHLGLKDTERTVGELQAAIRLEPDNHRLYATLRQVCLQEDRLDLARDALEQLLKQFPNNWHVRAGLGWAYRGLDKDDSALELLEDAIAPVDSLDGDVRRFALIQLGKIYLRQERLEEAARVLESALEWDKKDELTLLLLGECRLQQGQTEAARRLFDEALVVTKDLASTASHIAQLHYARGSPKHAIEYYERALQGQATPMILNNLAWTYAKHGVQLDRALRLSLRAVKSDADNVVYLDTYAELLYLQKEFDRATALMEQALRIEPPEGEHFEYLQSQLEKFQRRPYAEHL